MTQVTSDLSLYENLLDSWKKELGQHGPKGFLRNGYPFNEELAHLWKENQTLRQEYDI